VLLPPRWMLIHLVDKTWSLRGVFLEILFAQRGTSFFNTGLFLLTRLI